MSLKPFADAFRGTLDSGVELYFWPTSKFKSEVVRLTQAARLDSRPGAHALYCSVRRRGTKRLTSTQELSRELEWNYGTALHYDVSRRGCEQLTSWVMDTIDPRYEPHGTVASNGGSSVRDNAWSVLRDVIRDPFLENSRLREDYVEREQVNLIRYIEGIVNDKMAYAGIRLFGEMYPADPYGLHEWGTIDEIQAITAAELTEFGRQSTLQSPTEIYIVGSLSQDEALERAQHLTEGFTPASPIPPERPVCEERTTWREVIEEQEVNQAKLIMGCRIEIDDMDDRTYTALAMMNIVLGEGMHSKLFKVVRERESLAYHVSSSMDRMAGHLSILGGIESPDYEKARDLAWNQVESMAKGDIDEDEMAATRELFHNRLRAIGDHPGSMAAFMSGARASDRWLTPDEWMTLVDQVSIDDIAECAARVHPHTVYLLRAPQ